jgi:hypothetical protein
MPATDDKKERSTIPKDSLEVGVPSAKNTHSYQKATVKMVGSNQTLAGSLAGGLSPKSGIGRLVWSWAAVSTVVVLCLGFGGAFMTSGHPTPAYAFFPLGGALFLGKFLTWEETKQSPPKRRMLISLIGIIFTIVIIAVAIWGTYRLNKSAQQTVSSSSRPAPTDALPIGSPTLPAAVCFAILMGQGNGDSVPVMTENPTSEALDNVTMEFEKQTYRNDSEVDPSLGQLDGQLNVGICRAKLSLGWPTFFLHPGSHSRLRYQITILSRNETFRELLVLRQQEGHPDIYCQDVQVFRNWNQLIYERKDTACR